MDNEGEAFDQITPPFVMKSINSFIFRINRAKKLTFADDHGDQIAEVLICTATCRLLVTQIFFIVASQNIYSEQLHYSSTNFGATDTPKVCCSIS